MTENEKNDKIDDIEVIKQMLQVWCQVNYLQAKKKVKFSRVPIFLRKLLR